LRHDMFCWSGLILINCLAKIRVGNADSAWRVLSTWNWGRFRGRFRVSTSYYPVIVVTKIST